MARAQNPSEPELQGQNLLWLMGDAANKGPLQARLQSKAKQFKTVQTQLLFKFFLFNLFKMLSSPIEHTRVGADHAGAPHFCCPV